ncbi:proline dehydrogenase family protein [Bacillus sp. ISL-37]|uniref:proline dehydrogenase family protein n=1 Tax=Bacillus sp. ISL-37 TaxID=2819123 RepID=UPI001BEA9E0F|nr:proline dehydrogenase family protein [Bacillus sp. ISL-37]MBT2682231.1 proline dehydrogenase family protein [Bacillus sp. ISL-37]
MALSKNQLLNASAKKWGLKLGAGKVVAGIDIDGMIDSVKNLNSQGISATVDHLGEFVFNKQEAIEAKENILKTLQAIKLSDVDAHLSIKLTQVGLDVDYEFCLNNMRDISKVANEYGIFVNIDMEDYSHLQLTFDIIEELRYKYDNIGTVIQAYLYRSENDLERLKHIRLRLVKGAYKENDQVSLQKKEEIDANYLKLIKKRLQHPGFTSIATHDHNVINEVKQFVIENDIPKDKFEFQMLYGFRTDMQLELVEEGYSFCTYVPFGHDWYGYFMRRLAERPQNLNLVLKSLVAK